MISIFYKTDYLIKEGVKILTDVVQIHTLNFDFFFSNLIITILCWAVFV